MLALFGEQAGEKVEITKVAIEADAASTMADAICDAIHEARISMVNVPPH